MQPWQELRPSTSALRLAYVAGDVEADPVPMMLTLALREMDIPSEVSPCSVDPEEFESCIDHLRSIGVRGVVVGNPHKATAAKIAHKFYVAKLGLGVANALTLGTETYARNTEVTAFMGALEGLESGTALVMGSGRGARSVVLGLFEKGWQVRLWNRNAIHMRPFVTLFERYGQIEMLSQPDPSGCRLVVNATALGAKAGEQPPILWERARPKTVAIDLVYRNVATEFLRQAAQRGFKTVDGRWLVSEALAQALEWWTQREVPREPMHRAIGLVRT